MAPLSDIPSQLVILLILLPGFITFFVERALAYQEECQAAELIAKSLVYSLLTFVCTLAFDKWVLRGRFSLIAWGSAPKGAQVVAKLNPQLAGLLEFVLVAFALGLVIGLLKTHDWHMRVARGLWLTKRTGQVSTWLDVFHRYYPPQRRDGPDVSVILKDGRQIVGYPEYFSDSYHDGPVLFLVQARWCDGGKTVSIPDPGILLCGGSIECVQFYKEAKDGKREGKRAEARTKAGGV